MHNGVFKNLNTVIEFYDHQGGNQQRVNNPETGTAWQAAEVPETVSRHRLGIRNAMSDADINNLECFLRTLTDQKFERHLPTLREGLSCS
jgi:cytochrome c peroxidase